MVIEAYRDLARCVLARPPRLGRTRLVAVDGPSGAGKTLFAQRLAAALGAAPVVHTDDLLDGWGDQITFWPRLEECVLAPIRAGRAGRYRAYDWYAARFGDEWHTVSPAPVVILEGVSAARAEIRGELTLAVFVDAPGQLRLDRVLARDGAAILPYLLEWRRGEERHFAADATARYADLVVAGASEREHDPETEYMRLVASESVKRAKRASDAAGT